jgi:two-component system chemotaxis sensor kinase CheA
MSEMNQDAGLLQEYLTECDELIQRLDQDLVALETAAEDKTILNRVFRAFHTIKGTSGFMGFSQIVELTHHAEDVLNLLRKGERKVTRRTMDVLLSVLDQLRHMLADVRNDTPKMYVLGTLLGSLRQLMEGEAEERPTIGEILVAEKAITHSERADALEEAVRTDRKLGEVLVQKQLVSASQVKDALKQQAAAPEREVARTIRVDVAKLDALVNLVGELVLERNRLIQLNRDLEQQRLSAEKFQDALTHSTSRLSFITEELQSASLKTRMVPIDMTLRRFPRLVRDVALGLGKEVDLIIRGEDTELDKTVVEEISDPLVHLVRNSLDHGIEPPAAREAAGKPRKGAITMEARQEGDHILVFVSDDGAGIDPQRIARKAVEKGLIAEERAATLTRREILDLIFLPGFSTAERVSDVSGRGVGMDVVRTNLERMNGLVEIDSEPGRGTTVTLRLPLTLAILPALLVRVSEETYAVPLRSVLEAVHVRANELHRVEGNEILRLRDRVLPVQRLRSLFGLSEVSFENGRSLGANDLARRQADRLCVVIIGVGEKRFGLVVDELLGQEETVIKPLSSYLKKVPGLAGATIGGDGQVRLILDPTGIAGTLTEAQA